MNASANVHKEACSKKCMKHMSDMSFLKSPSLYMRVFSTLKTHQSSMHVSNN